MAKTLKLRTPVSIRALICINATHGAGTLNVLGSRDLDGSDFLGEKPVLTALSGRLFNLADRLRFRLLGGVLRRPLGRVSDADIDRALARLGLSRPELFTVKGAGAVHRRRLSAMMKAHGDVADEAVNHRWDDLKLADNLCAYCQSIRRCRSWLQWGSRNDAPRMFCPNSEFLSNIESRMNSKPTPGTR